MKRLGGKRSPRPPAPPPASTRQSLLLPCVAGLVTSAALFYEAAQDTGGLGWALALAGVLLFLPSLRGVLTERGLK